MKIYLHSLSFCRQNLQLQHPGSLANMAAQKLQKHTLITNGLDNTGAHAEAEAMMWTVEQLRRWTTFHQQTFSSFFLSPSRSLAPITPSPPPPSPPPFDLENEAWTTEWRCKVTGKSRERGGGRSGAPRGNRSIFQSWPSSQRDRHQDWFVGEEVRK